MVQHWRLDCVVPGDAGITILWDSGNYSLYETLSHHRNLGCSKVFTVEIFITSCDTSGVITEPVIFTDKSGFGFRFLTFSSCITATLSLVFVIVFIILYSQFFSIFKFRHSERSIRRPLWENLFLPSPFFSFIFCVLVDRCVFIEVCFSSEYVSNSSYFSVLFVLPA